MLVATGAAVPRATYGADERQRVQQRGTLIWGADAEGGGPYVFPRDDAPDQLAGFEVELAEQLAKHLGVRAQFQQGQWDKLPDLLTRGDIDIVLNGYEWRPEWADRFGTSIPYYVYELQWLARLGDGAVRELADLAQPPRDPVGRAGRWRVAVLAGSAAHDYLAAHHANSVEPVPFDGLTDALRAVELGTDGLAATLQDLPGVTFYERGFPGLRRIGPPVGRGYYVILVPRDASELLQAINDAIVASLRDGSLRQILSRYGLWTESQQMRALETDAFGRFDPALSLPPPSSAEPSVPAQSYVPVRGWHVIRQRSAWLFAGAWMTIQLAVVSMPLAIVLGLGLALGRLYGPGVLRSVCALYVEIIRGTPLVLQLYVIFFLLPELGWHMNAFWAAIMGLAMNYSAYEAEIYRAGLQAIPAGQMEAALALGMSRPLALRRIIIPQATRLVIPPVTNDFIALFKDTAVCSVITLVELSKGYYIQARSTGGVLELGCVTAGLYLAMSYPLSVMAGYLERRLRAGGTS